MMSESLVYTGFADGAGRHTLNLASATWVIYELSNQLISSGSNCLGPVDGGKNPSQQRGSLPVPQLPIRLTNVWYGRPDKVMDPLPSRG